MLFPSEEIIRDSALFKASSFHQLSNDQVAAEESVIQALSDVLNNDFGQTDQQTSKLIFVQGAAGTGKTVLLSHLFYRISTEINFDDADYEDDDFEFDGQGTGSFGYHRVGNAYILVNHEQQVHVYNQIATKLGLQSQSGTVVMKPSRFINKFSERDENSRGNPNAPKGKADVVLNRTPTRSTRISIPTIMIPGAVRAPWR